MLTTSAIDQMLMRLAAPRHGIVLARDAIRHGVPPSSISRRVKSGVARWVFPGVLAVGPAAFDLTDEALQHASLLHAGPGGALSHAFAASHQRIYDRGTPTIHVSSMRKITRGPNHGVRFHHTYTLRPEHLTTGDGRTWTIPTRTCFDLASGHTLPRRRFDVDRVEDVRQCT